MEHCDHVQQAWQLWNMLDDWCRKLWEMYEDEFIGFCIEECELTDTQEQ